MKCYNHNDRDAIGINIVTGKALCKECLEEYKGMTIEKDNEFSKNAVEKIITSYGIIGNTISFSKPCIVLGFIVIILALIMFFIEQNIIFVGMIFLGVFSVVLGFLYKKR